MTQRWAAARAAGADSEVTRLTRSSGKMLLLHKLLAKLRAEGKQVRGSCSCERTRRLMRQSSAPFNLTLARTHINTRALRAPPCPLTHLS